MATFNAGFVIFPNLTQLDFTGPLQVLHRLPQAQTHVAAKSLDPVPSDCGLSLVPTRTFEECCELDLICVPGGFGVAEALADRTILEFVRGQAEGAAYITSVCTGAFILGAAGLLRGRRATTHWGLHRLAHSRRCEIREGALRAGRQSHDGRRRHGRNRFCVPRGGADRRSGRGKGHSAVPRVRSGASVCLRSSGSRHERDRAPRTRALRQIARSLSISTERLGCVIGRRARPLERLLARGCGYGDRRPRLLRLAEGERICARERKTAQVRCGLGLRDDA